MKLTKKELLRRIRITKPNTYKRMLYTLIFMATCLGITIKEENK